MDNNGPDSVNAKICGLKILENPTLMSKKGVKYWDAQIFKIREEERIMGQMSARYF